MQVQRKELKNKYVSNSKGYSNSLIPEAPAEVKKVKLGKCSKVKLSSCVLLVILTRSRLKLGQAVNMYSSYFIEINQCVFIVFLKVVSQRTLVVNSV